MAETKKYLDLVGLGVYDEKIKDYIDKADAAVQSDAASDAASKAEGALTSANAYTDTKFGEAKTHTDTEVAKANTAAAAADAKGAQGIADAAVALSAANGAQTAADKAQGDVNALAGKVGAVPENQNVWDVITNIQENAYDDTNIRGLISENTQAIATEKGRAEGVEAGLQTAVEAAQAAADAAQADIDAFMSAEAIKEGAIDTLKEIQEYITSDLAAADLMTKSIGENAAAIEAEAARAAKAEGDLETAYKAADTALDGRIALLEEAIGDEGSVEEMIDAAVMAEAKLRDDADKALDAKIATAQAAAEAAQDEVDTLEGVVSALDGVVAGKVAQDDFDDLAGRVGANETAIAGINNHSHSNKAALDRLTSELMGKIEAHDFHTHSNKAILDGILQSNIDAWNAAEQNAKDYADDKFVWAANYIQTGDIDELFK